MYKAGLYALTLITALTTGSVIASAQSYSRAVNLPGVPGLVVHDAVPDGFDPASASASDLEEYGFPQRPDPSDAKHYASWLAAVSTTRVTGEWVTTGRYHLPNQGKINSAAGDKDNSSASGNWSGFAIIGGSPFFVQVEGRWAIPSVASQHESFTGYMSEWVGIDGVGGTNELMQDGTAQQWVGGKPGYYAWVEYFPEGEVKVPLSVSAGQVVLAYTWASEVSGVIHANFFLGNYNTGQHVSGFIPIPKGTSFSGKSTEWIVERTEVDGNFNNPLPDYAYGYIDDAYAWRNGGSGFPYTNEVNAQICMAPPGVTTCKSSSEISIVGALGPDSMLFDWVRYD